MKSIKNASLEEREEKILTEFEKGNLPSFLRRLVPIHIAHENNGKKHKITVWVMPDYLSIGSDDDFVRIPMNPVTAQKIADYYGLLLPTTIIVDEVYRQAKIKLKPSNMPPGPEMTSIDFYLNHNKRIEDQLKGKSHGALTAGHKKDIVVTNRLNNTPTRRVAIYGWHRTLRDTGTPIQPLSVVHGVKYADYSHGIRLVGRGVVIDGMEYDLEDVLKDKAFAFLLSKEGALLSTKIPLDCS
ncbi:MAG: hypothetical protein HQK54_07475 [Oligoflexales bacterium]|nr:hypothetical protein [Oligoflexales bacterium]